MKPLIIALSLVVGLLAARPTPTEGQDCKWCETDGKWIEDEFTIVHWFHEASGTPYRECEGSAAPADVPVTSGPSPRSEGCDQCHPDYYLGTCSQHGFCNPDDNSVPGLIAELDHLVVSMRTVTTGAGGEQASKLLDRLQATPNLKPHFTRRTLQLSDCLGNVVIEWSVPSSFLDLVGSGWN